MKTLLRVFGIAAIILALAAGGFWLYRSRVAPPAGQSVAGNASTSEMFTQMVAAQRGDLNSAITVVGELAAVQKADLAFAEMSDPAPLITLDVTAGNTVKAGQVLATIDPAALPAGARPGRERPPGSRGEAGRSQDAGHRA